MTLMILMFPGSIWFSLMVILYQVGVGLMFFQQFVGINGVIFYAQQIFVSAGYNSNKIYQM